MGHKGMSIMKLLDAELDRINIMLGFIGYFARKNNDNKKLDIYDESNNSLYDTVNISITDNFIYFSFYDKERCIIEYTKSCDEKVTRIILNYIGKGEIHQRIDDSSNEISITVSNTCKVNFNSSFKAEFSVPSLKRTLGYELIGLEDSRYIRMEEDKCNLFYCGGLFTTGRGPTSSFKATYNNLDLTGLADAMISHPRNIELTDYTMGCCEDVFNGINSYILKHFSIYDEILMIQKERLNQQREFDCLIEKCINPKCDLPQTGTQKKRVESNPNSSQE